MFLTICLAVTVVMGLVGLWGSVVSVKRWKEVRANVRRIGVHGSAWIVKSCHMCRAPFTKAHWLKLKSVTQEEAGAEYEKEARRSRALVIHAATTDYACAQLSGGGEERPHKLLFDARVEEAERSYVRTMALREASADARRCDECNTILEVGADALQNDPEYGPPEVA